MPKAKRESSAGLVEAAEAHDPEATRQIRTLEAKVSRERELRKAAESKHHQVENELAAAYARQEFWQALEKERDAHPLLVRQLKATAPATAWLLLSDWHIEQTVHPSKTNGLNEFNHEIGIKRVRNAFTRWLYLVDSARRISKIKDAVVWAGGDMITGFIHDELVEGNSMSPMEAADLVEDLLIEGINTLLKSGKFDSIEILCNRGNHGRATPKKRIATGSEMSYEFWMYRHVAKNFRNNPKVRFTVAHGDQIIADCQGWKVRCQHGDALRYAGGIGGVTIPLYKAISRWNTSTRADHDILGHLHQHLSLYRATMNASLIGYDEFALHIGAEYQEPSQSLLIIDRERGVVDQRRVFVDKPRKAA